MEISDALPGCLFRYCGKIEKCQDEGCEHCSWIERREPEYRWPTAEEETLTREQFLADERKGLMS